MPPALNTAIISCGIMVKKKASLPFSFQQPFELRHTLTGFPQGIAAMPSLQQQYFKFCDCSTPEQRNLPVFILNVQYRPLNATLKGILKV